MLSFNATQTAIVASNFKRISWLFKVEITGTTYYWSTKAISYGGHTYTFKIIDFDGITLNRAKSELGIQAPDDISFTVSNKSNSLSAADFINKPVTVYLVISDLDNSNTTIATWKFNITRCESVYQKLNFTCETYINQYLEGDYPNTKRVKDISPSSDPDSNINDNLCVPIPFGTCYVPLRSLYITDQRYYVLGRVSSGTYSISNVHSPKEWGNSSEWGSGSYAFTQSTKTIDTVDWRVFQPIIADSDRDGTVDACGLWLSGDYFLDMPTEFYRDDTEDISGDDTGTHDGGNNQASLTNSGASWGVDKLIGFYVVNSTDGSYGKITDNTGTNVTATLEGGTDNDWDNGDTYVIGGPASVIKFVLEDFGVSSSDIDDTSFGLAEKTYAGWGLTFNGAFFYHQTREKILSLLLNMCHSILITEEGAIKLKVLSKTSQKTLTKADIINKKEVGEGTFKYSLITQKQSDSGYVAFQESGKPQDEFVKIIVPAKATADNISSDMLEIPFVQDGQNVQRIGTLHYQRKFLQKANISFSTKGTCLALQPDDVITINHADYGGNYAVLIDSIKINKDASMDLKCIEFSVAFDDWGDLTPDAITIATDDSTGIWQPVISGPDSELTGGEIPNYIDGRLRISNTVNTIILDSDQPMISLDENGTERLRIGNLNGYLGYSSEIYGIGIGDATNYLKFDSTNGVQLSISAASGITVYGGADIKLVGSDTDPGEIIWDHGSGKFVRMGSSTSGSERTCIYPYVAGYSTFYVGVDVTGATCRFENIELRSVTALDLWADDGASTYAKIEMSTKTSDGDIAITAIGTNSSTVSIVTGTITIGEALTQTLVIPLVDNQMHLGSSTYRWKNLYAVNGYFSNTGLQIHDTNASHYLTIAPGSDLTAARTLTLTTGDADRTITLSGNPTLADWFDQSVKVASSPTFANLTVTTALTKGGNTVYTLVDRGDPAAHDWTTGSFTKDGTWYDLDCSSIVPAGAYAIIFHIEGETTTANKYFRLRENGNSNSINALHFRTSLAGAVYYRNGIVACDSNRKVEYTAQNATWTQLNVTVRGWFV